MKRISQRWNETREYWLQLTYKILVKNPMVLLDSCYNVKLSLRLIKHHAIKAHCGSGDIAPRILNLGTKWRRVVSFTLRPPYPGVK